MPMTSLREPHRLLPAEPTAREIAIALYDSVAELPIISPHGHVPVAWLSDNIAFANPADLLVVHDHYVTRLLHARGVSLAELGQGGHDYDPRAVWRIFAHHWHAFAGTASAYWIAGTLSTVFGIDEDLSDDNADATYDRIDALLATDDFRPRALFERFGITMLATTDDPLDDLAGHARLAADPTFTGRVLPTFRPDAYLDPEAPGFATKVQMLLDATGEGYHFPGYLKAFESRRAHFIANGAVSADHGVVEPYTCDLPPDEAERLFGRVMAGTADTGEVRTFRGHMLWQMARMSVEDGLVMTIHAGVRRNHHSATFGSYGPDTGHDIPLRTEYTDNLRALLESFGTASGFHLGLFTVDETTFSRELAPLAGFYPSVYVGAPWWFLDAPEAMARYRSAVTETAGFYRGTGFIDDTRAFMSIPARHDTSRRADAGYLARLVVEGRITRQAAERIIVDLVATVPTEVFKL